jgi:glutamate-1-semialdehyde 2,1-aminomutase
VIGEPPLFEVVFTTDTSPIRDYQGTARGDMEMARRFNALLREHGILKGEQKYYVSLAHNDDDIRHTREAWASAIKVLAK